MLTFKNEMTGESVSLNCSYSITETLNSSIIINGSIEELPNNYSFNGAWTTNALGVTFWIVIESRNASASTTRLSFTGIDDFTYQFNNISADNELDPKVRPISEYIDFINKESLKPGKDMLRPEGKRYTLENRVKNVPNLKLEGFGNKKLSDLLKQLINRFDIEIRPHNTDPYIMILVDRREGVFEETVRDSINLTNTEFSIDKTNLVTRQRIIGSFNEETGSYYDVTYTDEKMASKYGILDGTPIKDDRFKNKDAMVEYAKKIISESFAPSLTIDFDDMSNMYGNLTAGLGEFIRVINESIGLDVVYRVLEITRNFDYTNQEISKKVLLGSQRYYNQRQFRSDDVIDMMGGVSDTLINESQEIRDDFANKVPYVPRRLEDGDFNITYDTKMPNNLYFKNNDDGTMNLGGIKFDENNKVIEIDDFCCKCCQGGGPGPSDKNAIYPNPSNITPFYIDASYDPEDEASWFKATGYFIGDDPFLLPDTDLNEEENSIRMSNNPILNITSLNTNIDDFKVFNRQSNNDKRFIAGDFNIEVINFRSVIKSIPSINYNDFIVSDYLVSKSTFSNASYSAEHYSDVNTVDKSDFTAYTVYRFGSFINPFNEYDTFYNRYNSSNYKSPFSLNLDLKYCCGFSNLAHMLYGKVLHRTTRNDEVDVGSHSIVQKVLEDHKQFIKRPLYLDINTITTNPSVSDRVVREREGLKAIVPDDFMVEYEADLYEIEYEVNIDGVFNSNNNAHNGLIREVEVMTKPLNDDSRFGFDGAFFYNNNTSWLDYNNKYETFRDNLIDTPRCSFPNHNTTGYIGFMNKDTTPVYGGSPSRDLKHYKDDYKVKDYFDPKNWTYHEKSNETPKVKYKKVGTVTLINETKDPLYVLDPYFERMHNIDVNLSYNNSKKDGWVDSDVYLLDEIVYKGINGEDGFTEPPMFSKICTLHQYFFKEGLNVKDLPHLDGSVYSFDSYTFKDDYRVGSYNRDINKLKADGGLNMKFLNGGVVQPMDKSISDAPNLSQFRNQLSEEPYIDMGKSEVEHDDERRYKRLYNYIYELDQIFHYDELTPMLQFMSRHNPELKVIVDTGRLKGRTGRTHHPYPESTQNINEAIKCKEDPYMLQSKKIMISEKFVNSDGFESINSNSYLPEDLDEINITQYKPSYHQVLHNKYLDGTSIDSTTGMLTLNIIYPYSFSSMGLPLDIQYDNKFKFRPIEFGNYDLTMDYPDYLNAKDSDGSLKKPADLKIRSYYLFPLSSITMKLRPQNGTQYLIPVYLDDDAVKVSLTTPYTKDVQIANDFIYEAETGEHIDHTWDSFYKLMSNQLMNNTKYAIDSRSIRVKSKKGFEKKGGEFNV